MFATLGPQTCTLGAVWSILSNRATHKTTKVPLLSLPSHSLSLPSPPTSLHIQTRRFVLGRRRGGMALNCGHNSTRRPQREKKNDNYGWRRKTKREILCLHPPLRGRPQTSTLPAGALSPSGALQPLGRACCQLFRRCCSPVGWCPATLWTSQPTPVTSPWTSSSRQIPFFVMLLFTSSRIAPLCVAPSWHLTTMCRVRD